MVISKIEPQKRHPERVNLYVDGVFVDGFDREVILRFGLRKGDQISEDILNKLRTSEEFVIARKKAIRLIKSRLRSEKEIVEKLRLKNFSPQITEKVLENLRSTGLINDEKFARAYIHDILLKKSSGRKYLAQKLSSKGIKKDIISSVLKELLSEDEEKSILLKSAKSYVSRQRKSTKKIDEQKIFRRTVQYLLRRGFLLNQIMSVVKPLFKNNYYMGEE